MHRRTHIRYQNGEPINYFDENEIEDGEKINCNIVVSKPELTDEDKTELKEQAMEQTPQTITA